MTQTYRTNDVTRWGTGKGSDLGPAEVDINFWDLIQRMATQEARPDPGPTIDHFSTSGALFYVHMSDGSVLGPYTLPVATFNDRGEWLPETAYAVMDTFTINGGLYVVLFDHTSDTSFDPGANDGAGHDYYSLMVQTPGSPIPVGGAVGQVVQKSTTTDYTVAWGWKTPFGGVPGNVIIKDSDTQDDVVWGALDAADVAFTPASGSTLTADNVADALEEAATMGGGGGGSIASFDEATAADYWSWVADKALSTDTVWGAAATVTLTDAATIAVNMSTFINATVTLGGNRTLGNPSNTKDGQTGVIKIAQDGSGSRTLAYSANWKFAGGTDPILTTTASAVDLLFYQVISSTFIFATLIKDVK